MSRDAEGEGTGVGVGTTDSEDGNWQQQVLRENIDNLHVEKSIVQWS